MPGGLPLLGNYRQYAGNQLDFWREVAAVGPVVRVALGPRKLWVITDAELLHTVLQTRARGFPRSNKLISEDSLDDRQTVFNAPTWEAWLWRRRLLQPNFHRDKLQDFAEGMRQETAGYLNEWPTDRPMSLKAAMKTLTMRIIGRTMFSAPLQQTALLQDCFEQINRYSTYQNTALVQPPMWLPLPLYRKTRAAYATRHTLVKAIVDQRLASQEPQDDLLDMLIAANLDDGTRFSAANIIHEMLSIIFAGHETTSMTLTWTLAIISLNDAIRQKVLDEVDRVLAGRAPELADLPNMPYAEQLLNEVMRMYPAVYATLREPESDEPLGEYTIPAGTEMLVNIRGLHYDPRYWPEADRFWPERFDPETSPEHNRLAFLPFLSGPRKCIGDSFAMMEMQLILPMVLQRWRLQPLNPLPPAQAGFVLQPEGPLNVSVRLPRSR
jgi:cytochrome P450